MSYEYDDSTIGEGVIAWLLFNLGVIPVIFYCVYLHTNKGRTYSVWGYLRKTSCLTFLVLMIVEIIVLVIVFVSIFGKYLS